jgi:hypothetical protein
MANKTNRTKWLIEKTHETIKRADIALGKPAEYTVDVMGQKVIVREVAAGVFVAPGVSFWGDEPDPQDQLKILAQHIAIETAAAAIKKRSIQIQQGLKASKPRKRTTEKVIRTTPKRSYVSIDAADLMDKVDFYVKKGYSTLEAQEKTAEHYNCSVEQVRKKNTKLRKYKG